MYLIIGILVAIVTLLIRAEFAQNRKQVYLLKPVATLLVIFIAVLSLFKPGNANMDYSRYIFIALLFSLGGDVALMFQSKLAFLIGLVLFLIAHIVYSIAFMLFNRFVPENQGIIIILLIVAAVVYYYLYPGLAQLKIPVLLYVLVISFMLNQAIATFYGDFFNRNQALLIAGGAALFYLSDLILAINKFRKPLRYNRLGLALYYGGQLCLALSTLFFGAT